MKISERMWYRGAPIEVQFGGRWVAALLWDDVSKRAHDGDAVEVCVCIGDVPMRTAVARSHVRTREAAGVCVSPEWSLNDSAVIETLDLRARLCERLRLAGITVVGDLTQATEVDLLKIRSLGPKSLREIKQALADRGLALKARS